MIDMIGMPLLRYRSFSYKSTLEVCSSSVHVRLSLEFWGCGRCCKAFQIASEVVRVRNSTIAVTVILTVRYHSSVEVGRLRYATYTSTKQRPSSHSNPAVILDNPSIVAF